MSEQNNIQEELRSLESSLPLPARFPFRVPDGYFDSLPEILLRKAKELPANEIRDELDAISPLLSSLSREMPYSVPKGYFEGLVIKEEEESISPMLSGLKDRSTYSVPDNYFEELPAIIVEKVKADKPARVIPIMRKKWFRMAAAAVVTGLIAGIVVFSGGSSSSVSPIAKKVSTEEINSLMELVKMDTISGLVQSNSLEDVKKLVKDVPEKEIQDLLNDASIDGMASDDDLLLN